MANPFKNVQVARPGRSVFDLSYEKKFTCDMGFLYPIMCDEVVPGDRFIIGAEVVARAMPMVAPILHQVDIYAHYYFVPYRLLWTDWEDFITGGPNGDNASTLPTWQPTAPTAAEGTLWDHFGFPAGIIPNGAFPMAFPRTAYNLVYNEFYRDENQIAEVSLDQEAILKRSWEKDYFTSCMSSQQRGVAPALPISGVIDVAAKAADITFKPGAGGTPRTIGLTSGGTNWTPNGTWSASANARFADPALQVDLGGAATFDAADIRLLFQMQRWMEMNARGGVRYTEWLQAQYGCSPRDERLDRPEYIGGFKTPLIVSEVLKTSTTDGTSPQGNMAGHGLSASRAFVAKYTASEFGLILGIMSIMPKPAYQQGINRQWLRETRYDFYNPLFAHLSEQAVTRAEIYASAVEAENDTVFGFQGRYNEMRYKPNQVAGKMRSTLNYWHLARVFGSAPALNQTFMECNGADASLKRIFAATAEPGFLVSWGNSIKAIRPMPVEATPGLE